MIPFLAEMNDRLPIFRNLHQIYKESKTLIFRHSSKLNIPLLRHHVQKHRDEAHILSMQVIEQRDSDEVFGEIL